MRVYWKVGISFFFLAVALPHYVPLGPFLINFHIDLEMSCIHLTFFI